MIELNTMHERRIAPDPMIKQIGKDSDGGGFPMPLRDRVRDYLISRLVGPIGGDTEELDDDPINLYTAGILHPQPGEPGDSTSGREVIDVEGGHSMDSAHSGAQEDDGDDEPVVLASQHYPSVLGVSFLISGASPVVDVHVNFALYVQDRRRGVYARKPLLPAGEMGTPYRLAYGGGASHDLMDGSARLRGIFRRHRHGWLVTVVLMNLKRTSGPSTDNLFQPSLCCAPGPGCSVLPWPVPPTVAGGPEVAELEMAYRNRKVYAVGHGCAAQWDTTSDPPPTIHSEVMPWLEVPATDFRQPDGTTSRVLRIGWISENPQDLIALLGEFVSKYEAWIERLDLSDEARADQHAVARATTIARLRTAVSRMHRGVDVLRTDSNARTAFCLASSAMLAQMNRVADYRQRSDAVPAPPTTVVHDPADHREWRPFQLAYQLQVLSSLVQADAKLEPDREVVDLLWFPTGGGKTEAYLALVAFELFYRRLRFPGRSGGTAIIMRYTLRLLTTQQFQRATALVCAAELLRREHMPAQPPVTIGLWVGATQTPNSIQDAEALLEDAYRGSPPRNPIVIGGSPPRNPFVIERCGWCGTHLMPVAPTEDRGKFGFRIVDAGGAMRLSTYCTHPDCPYHSGLPVVLIDDDIYRTPPSFLLGTVDKFARLAWEAKAGAIFGANTQNLPPGLIIQDELHLINGPLGTIVGIYEAAIDELASRRPGFIPKVIAATATIRSASEQVRAIYDREVAIFPPPGLNASDSYFARDDHSRPGRLYVGVFSDTHSGQMTVARVLAALLHAPDALGLVNDRERDAYWTLVGYHNSLRELGKVLTLASDDVPNWMRTFRGNNGEVRRIGGDAIQELTSNRSGSELVELLARLERPLDISVLLATNMLSVGVDIDRLGLMFVNGQPKSTSEYIQATSRVGRSGVPGLIVTYYASSKPRDRSHYERFQSYHQALYRAVEPMSVTPFAEPARRRALHAALVIIVRHRLGLAEEESAPDFKALDPEIRAQVKEYLLGRIKSIDPSEYERSKDMYEQLESEWLNKSERNNLRYGERSRQFTRLIMPFEETSGPRPPVQRSGRDFPEWRTLNSMRNVDQSVVIQNIDRQHR